MKRKPFSLRSLTRKLTSLTRKGRSRPFSNTHGQLAMEQLEGRVMLSTIAWTNRGTAINDSDGFGSVFGANAEAARITARGALDLWERVITDFKQSDGANRIDVSINMYQTGIGFGGDGALTTFIGNKPC